MPRRNTPDHSYFDSVSTQLELSVVSLFSGGREKAPPNKVVRHIASSATNSVRPQRRMTRRGSVFGLESWTSMGG